MNRSKTFLPIGTVVKIKAQAIKTDESSSLFAPGAPIQGVNWKIGVKSGYCRFESGIIVGGTYIQEGDLSNTFEGGSIWKAVKQHFVYLVRPAFTMRPIKVFPEDLETDPERFIRNTYLEQDRHIIPFSGSTFQWTDKMKKMWSEEMSKADRDEKGRWK